MPASLRTVLRPPSQPTSQRARSVRRARARDGIPGGDVQLDRDAVVVLRDVGDGVSPPNLRALLECVRLEQRLGARLRDAEHVRVIGVEAGEVERLVERGEVRERHLRPFGEESVDDAAPVEDLEAARVEVERAHEARAARRCARARRRARRASPARRRAAAPSARRPRSRRRRRCRSPCDVESCLRYDAHRVGFLRGSVCLRRALRRRPPRRFASASSASDGLVDPRDLRGAQQLAAAEHRHVHRAEDSLGDETRSLRGDPFHLALQHVASRAEQREHDAALADAAEGERHGHRIGRLPRLGDRLLAQDRQLAPPSGVIS